MKLRIVISLALIVSLPVIGKTQPINLYKATVIASKNIKSPVRETAIRVLQEEVHKRNKQHWKETNTWPSGRTPVIAMVLTGEPTLDGNSVPHRPGEDLAETKSEGYRLLSEQKEGKTVIWIIGADASGVMFGVGHLLRLMHLPKNKALLPQPVDIATAPQSAIRGHQLGYRNTANSYDAWTVEQYEQYIRDLMIFGTNAIENIPLSSRDDSPHMKITRGEMNRKISEICANYNMQYWLWTPGNVDLSKDDLFQKELEKHEVIYKNTPRITDIFFPGGDPGKNHPRDVLPFLKSLSGLLKKHHPEAGIWISLQKFDQEEVDYFYQYLKKHDPDWLRGVVSGPSSPPTAETRFRLPEKYLHRLYPDITHNVRCEYPTNTWDQAYALTIGREGINPMPYHFSKVHRKYADFTDGFVSYSDGCHDDVNKVIWSMCGWDIEREVRDILVEYSRFFFGQKNAENVAEGILGLEHNWLGPLAINGSVETTFGFWKQLETSNPQLTDNWRWQMFVLRAYYDTYLRRRLIYEQQLEKDANNILAKVEDLGCKKVMENALILVKKADSERQNVEMRETIIKLCDDLFKSIGLQTSVSKYQASNSQRGCILDFVDYPLNNRWWLEDEFKKIDAMESVEDKKARLEIIRTWENPGPGSYYDNVSNIAQSPHVKSTVYDAVDFAWWDSGYSRARLSSQVYQNEPILEYEDLDPDGRYIFRIAGYGDALIRVDGYRLHPMIYNKVEGTFKEFVVPRMLVGDGQLKVTFDRPEESHMRWRNYSRISDIWLIKQ
jgi:hypothetical protein